MVPGFEAELMASKDRGIRYAVFAGTRNLGEKQLDHPSGADDIRIAPVLVGSKAGGLFQTILGVVMIGAAVFGGPLGFGLLSSTWAMGLGMAGMSLALGGIAQMMAPHQSGESKSLQSYNFNGAQNTTQQGGPVPLLYGRMRVGSVVISEGLLAKDGTAQLVGGHLVSTT
ncbi:hypothetical protein R6138_01885 [Ralstonia thomasii]|nr:hypothetical protein R6138_01885 [Ralstonia sp. LMG 18095]